MTQPTAPAVSALLLGAVRELTAPGVDDWDPTIDRLLAALDGLPLGEHEVLRAVLVASAVIEEFLLELALRPSDGRPAELIFETLAGLLEETA
jgi:hypothetical protein